MRVRVALLLAGALAGCTTVGPDYRAPEASALPVPDAYYSRPGEAAAPADLSRWWEQFDDPLLTRLIDEASAGNLDLAQASTRLVQARELLVQARAGLVPPVGASAGAGRTFGAGNDRNSFNVGADASWEIDLFGRIRRGIEAAGADAESVYFDREALRVAIAAEVATNYIQARQAQERLALARDTLGIADDNLQIAQWRVQAGLVSSLDSEQARAARAQTAAVIPNLENAFTSATFRLAVLTGRAPGALTAELSEAKPIPQGPRGRRRRHPRRHAAPAPRRPLRRAQPRRADRADRRRRGPALSGAPPQRQYRHLGLLARRPVRRDHRRHLLEPQPDPVRRRPAALAGPLAAAATEGALAAYRQSVLTALEDVENALLALRAARERQAQFAIAFEAANNSAILARIQYRSGLTDFQQLLDAERSLLSARDGMASSRGDEALALVQLYRALGGGWDADAAPQIGRNG